MLVKSITWNDSTRYRYKTVMRCGRKITPHEKGGWVTDIPGDTNRYKNRYAAMYAIDVYCGKKPTDERLLKYAGAIYN